MPEEQQKIKYPGFLNKVWHDPIWSKVIYTGIILLLGLLYSFIVTVFKNISLKQALIDTIYFDLKLYLVFIFVSIGLLSYGLIYRFRQKRNKRIGNFDVEQPIGNFTFRELYNALLTTTINTPIKVLQTGFSEPKINLLTLFVLYQRQLNRGIEWSHDHFTYYDLGPTLMTYGLTEKTPTKNKLDSIGSDMIQTSQIGYDFYALLERWRIHNDLLQKETLVNTDTGNTLKKETKE
ncbi:MAG: hypothetical protein RIB71_16240 [Imperialibacter sp.]|uniref:hypothetical protein n=1 Tax=Imperialibacter sp. TaxID=2038411 RepID=UPI0032EE41E0